MRFKRIGRVAQSAYFDWPSDPDRLADVIAHLPLGRGVTATIERKYRNGKNKEGAFTADQFRLDAPILRQVDIDFFSRPGNPDIRGWAYLELKLEERTAHSCIYGDEAWFSDVLIWCEKGLGLTVTKAQIFEDTWQRCESMMIPELFGHIRGSLKEGNYAAALSAAVVFIEDRLRSRIGTPGKGLTGSDLAVYAFKNPGVLIPPLAYAENAQDGAFLLVKGWFGLVRNFHGHQALLPIGPSEAYSQLMGANYMLWVIDNSQEVQAMSLPPLSKP